ncbi:MAG: 50S ribosomal protein L29 [Patescibacteria group bacterium]
MSQFSGKTKQDLLKLLGESQEALHNFRFGIAGSKVRNVKEGRLLRRDIAEIKTFLNNPNIA